MLDTLSDQILTHVKHEEQLMADIGYNQQECVQHIQDHNNLINTISEILAHYERYGPLKWTSISLSFRYMLMLHQIRYDNELCDVIVQKLASIDNGRSYQHCFGNIIPRKITILIEDESLVRNAIKLCLEDAGYAVIDGPCVAMVAFILRLCRTSSYHTIGTVIVDYWLEHGMNGITVIRCLKRLCSDCLNYVLITGDNNPEVSKKALEERSSLLIKPFRFEQLLDTIDYGASAWSSSGRPTENVVKRIDGIAVDK